MILMIKDSFLYPPQRWYISFVNTFVTPRNNDLVKFHLKPFSRFRVADLFPKMLRYKPLYIGYIDPKHFAKTRLGLNNH